MNSSVRPLILTATVVAILIVAGFASLFVLDLVPRDQLQDAFVRVVLVLVILTVASLAVWGTVRLAGKD